MAKRPLIEAKKRREKGSRAAAKLRRQGVVPAVIYGSGVPEELLTVDQERLREIIESRSRMVEVKIGSKAHPAILKEIQYDHLGSDICHVDFERINLQEVVRVEVAIETHGAAKGTKSGGILELVHKHLTVECKADDIPSEITVEVGDLDIGQSISVSQLTVPETVKVLDDPHTIVIIVQAPRKEAEVVAEAEGVEQLAEPEVITARKETEEDAEEEEK